MKALRNTAGVVNAICLVLLALYFSVQMPTFSTWFYAHEYEKNNIYAKVQMEEADLLAVTAHMIDYMRGKADTLNVDTQVAGEPRPFFSEREILHMEDVRGLFDAGRMIRNVSAVLFIATAAFLVWLRKDGLRSMMKSWSVTAFSTLGLGSAIGIAIALGFDRAFTAFHEVFFNNDLWLLNPDVDLLVNIVPTPFFVDIAGFIGITFVLVLAVMGTGAAVALRGLRR